MTWVRHTEQRDVMEVADLMNRNLDDYFAPEVVDFFLMQWPTGQFVATDPFGNILGALCGARLSGGRVSIHLFAVEANHRGQKIGSQLYNEFWFQCRMEGISLIQLEVRTTNVRAMEFYKRRGFVVTEELKGFYNDGGDGYRMVANVNFPLNLN